MSTAEYAIHHGDTEDTDYSPDLRALRDSVVNHGFFRSPNKKPRDLGSQGRSKSSWQWSLRSQHNKLKTQKGRAERKGKKQGPLHGPYLIGKRAKSQVVFGADSLR